MHKLQNNKAGFSLIEALLIVIIILIVGFIGGFVWHSKQTADKTLASASAGSSVPVTKQQTKAKPSTASTAPPAQVAPVPAPANSYAVLAPATVPSKTAECSQTLTKYQDGSSGPASCTNGDLNVLEWNDIKTSNANSYVPSVMSLSYGSTEIEVQTALCNDYKTENMTGVVEGNAYAISALYYGWHFTTDPFNAMIRDNAC